VLVREIAIFRRTVPNASHATSADNATSATSATTAAVTNSVASASIRIETNCTVWGQPQPATDCNCAANEIAISGGAWAGGQANALNDSSQGLSISGGAAQLWRVSCADAAGNRVVCANPFALCLRVQ
jgi:hypothetical protein